MHQKGAGSPSVDADSNYLHVLELQFRRWHVWNQNLSLRNMVLVHTLGPYNEQFLNKTIPNGLGWTDQYIHPFAPLILVQPLWTRYSVQMFKCGWTSSKNEQRSCFCYTPDIGKHKAWNQVRLNIRRATNSAHTEKYWTWWVVSSKENQFSASRLLCFVCTWN
jgi:hypothetical protein